MSVVSRKSGKIFEQKYCEHVITEVKFLEGPKKAAFTGENQSMINHVQNNFQRLAHARHDFDYGSGNQFEYSFAI